MLGCLSCPDGDDGVENAGSPSVDEARWIYQLSASEASDETVHTTDHPISVLSRTLKGGPDDSPESAKGDCFDTTKVVTKPAADETSD